MIAIAAETKCINNKHCCGSINNINQILTRLPHKIGNYSKNGAYNQDKSDVDGIVDYQTQNIKSGVVFKTLSAPAKIATPDKA